MKKKSGETKLQIEYQELIKEVRSKSYEEYSAGSNLHISIDSHVGCVKQSEPIIQQI